MAGPEAARIALDQARAALEAADPQAAFERLRPVLRYESASQPTSPMADDSFWAEAVALLAKISRDLHADDLVAPLERLAEDPDGLADLFHVGCQLIEQGAPEVAATFLERAHLLEPENPDVLFELVVSLESLGRYGQAREYLEAAPAAAVASFMGTYLRAFQALMTGDLEAVRRFVPRMVAVSDDERFMAQRIERAVVRANSAGRVSPLDREDLRGWHLVIQGGLLLHCSPWGRSEGMNGRYAFVQDSAALCREGIERLAAVLRAAGHHPPQVFALPDRSSAILAAAVARRLGLPLREWPLVGGQEPGLLVAYDLGLIPADRIRSLLDHRPGQILWAHATRWVEEFPISADVTTFLYQFNIPFWEEQVRVDAAGRTDHISPDERTVEELAAHILAQELAGDALADESAVLALTEIAAALPEAAMGPFANAGPRPRLWIGGPVLSSRFD